MALKCGLLPTVVINSCNRPKQFPQQQPKASRADIFESFISRFYPLGIRMASYSGEVIWVEYLKRNQNAPIHSEHPLVRGEKYQNAWFGYGIIGCK